MAQQTDSWSSCKRPSEIVRLRKKRARSASESPGESDFSPASIPSAAPLSHGYQSRSRGKRRNPFATWDNTVSRSKKVLVESEDGEGGGALRKLMSTESRPTSGDCRVDPSRDSMVQVGSVNRLEITYSSVSYLFSEARCSNISDK